MRNLQAKVLISIAFAALIYIGFAIWTSFDQLKEALSGFHFAYLPLILLLTLLNYFIRFCNWQYYLKTLGIKVKRRDSFLVYVAGFSMSITPGKLGEVVRSVLLKQAAGIPVSKTASLTFVDRLTDMLALVLIASVGAFSFEYGQKLIWVVAVVIVLLVGILTWRRLAEYLLDALTRRAVFKNRREKIYNLYESAYVLLVPRRLMLIIFLSLLGWGCEAVGFYLTFLALDLPAGIGAAFFIYAFSTIVGAISLLPGGLGLTEGSMAGLLLLTNVSRGVAAAATLVIRICTLWFGVVLGAIFLIITQRRFGRLKELK